jgi:hypothetical protein
MDPHTGEDPTPAASRPTRTGRFLCWVLFILLTYPLGSGPAYWVAHRFQPLYRPIDTVYSPLGALADAFGPVARVYDWYLVDVWRTGRPKAR